MTEVVRGLASLRGADDPADLTIPLGLSAWIIRASIGLPDAYEAMMRVRDTLLETSGIDRRTEPVPLRVADPKAALRSLGSYLYGLVGRAARHAGLAPVELAERAVGALAAPAR